MTTKCIYSRLTKLIRLPLRQLSSSPFARQRLVELALQSREMSLRAVQDRAHQANEFVTDWFGPDEEALRNLCRSEERIWLEETRNQRRSTAACGLMAALAFVSGVVLILIPGSASWITLEKFLGLIALFTAILTGRQALVSGRVLWANRARGYLQGADGAFTNYGQSLVGMGSRHIFVTRNRRECFSGWPVVDVYHLDTLSAPELVNLETETIISLKTNTGELIRNLIYHGMTERAGLAESQIAAIISGRRNHQILRCDCERGPLVHAIRQS